jgi:hypothetical protein
MGSWKLDHLPKVGCSSTEPRYLRRGEIASRPRIGKSWPPSPAGPVFEGNYSLPTGVATAMAAAVG